MSLTKPY